MDDDTIRRRVVVEGRVQGVFFRDACRREATAAGLAGWARNRHDGSVEVVVEGRPAAVEQLVAWCRTGPPRAMVTAARVEDERPEGLRGFSVR
ncbi:MAG: acylphosphatase [Actinomycetota bacterium]